MTPNRWARSARSLQRRSRVLASVLVTSPNPSRGDTAQPALLVSVPSFGGALQVFFEHSAQRQAAATCEVMRGLAEQVRRELSSGDRESPELRAMFPAWEGPHRTGVEWKRWLRRRMVKQALHHPAEFNDAWSKLEHVGVRRLVGRRA